MFITFPQGQQKMIMHNEVKAVPDEVVIEVTAQCNFKCTGCFNQSSFAQFGRHDRLELAHVKRIIDSCCDAGVEMIRFTGGEALLRPDLFAMADHAIRKGAKTRLNTNAANITPSNAHLIARYFDSVLISFNGFDAASDEAWTNTANSFAQKLAGLELLSSESAVKIRMGTVLTRANIQNLEKIYEIISPFRPAHWEVYRPITTQLKESIALDIEEVMIKLAYLSYRMGSIVPIANAIPFCLHDKTTMSKICRGAVSDDGHSRIIIDPRGFAKPSYYINENIGDPTDIRACWAHPFLKSMRELKMVPPECRDCEYLSTCKGGSRYKAKVAHGHYEARDPLMKSK